MARLPQVGGDDGNWGAILNEYLLQSHAADGTLNPDSVGISQLQPDAVTSASIADSSVSEDKLSPSVQGKLNATPVVESVAGKTGAVSLIAGDVGLGNVDNTRDSDKPISTATQAALDDKASVASVQAKANNSDVASALATKVDAPDYVASSSVSGSVSLGTYTKSSIIHYTLIGNLTISALPSSPNIGMTLTLVLTQDSTGSRTITLPGTVKRAYGLSPVLSTAAGSVDMLHLFWDGVSWNVFVAGLALS